MWMFIRSLFTQHKMKIFLFSAFSTVFVLLLFPFGDLSDWASAKVSAATGNNVYVQFDDMGLTLNPFPAIYMTNVSAEVARSPEITLTELSVTPSIIGAIKQKIMGRVQGAGLFQGEIDLNVSGSSKIRDPQALSAQLEFVDFNIKDTMKSVSPNIPVAPSGRGSVSANVDFEPAMKTQPEGDVTVQLQKLQVPAFSVPLAAFGSLPVPGLNLDKVQLKGKLKGGKLQISETVLGSPKDELSGKISGEMDMRFMPNFSNFNVGAYNLAVDITIRDGLQNQLGSYMGIVDGMVGRFKSSSLGGTRYSFRMQARSFQDPPQFSPL